MDYYTLQIEYIPNTKGIATGAITVEFKDLERPPALAVNTWYKSQISDLYIKGIALQTAPGTYELISPLRIRTAYLIKQPGKIGV